MKSKIMLQHDKGYSWCKHQNVAVKGYAFDKDDNFLEGESLANLFADVNSLDALEKIVRDLNGLFAVVVESGAAIYLATDITRTFPLFYFHHKNEYVVSDDANYIKAKYNPSFNENAEQEFLCAGYVTGNQTLLNGLSQLQAAEIVELKQKTVAAKEYWTYATNKTIDKPIETLQAELLAIYERVVTRLIASAKGKTIVIPLSGGYDSRLIAVLLKKRGYSNVICYTYGKQNCFEAKRSKAIAEELGFQWLFIEYTVDLIKKYFDNKNEWNEYAKFSGNYCMIPHIQDFIAIMELKSNKRIPQDSIIVPGHSGDIFAGTHIPRNIEKLKDNKSYKEVIRKKHFQYCSHLAKFYVNFDNKLLYSVFESWSWKERQAKFIVNSVRAYDYCGFKYALPLWDKELASFFKMVSLEFKNRQGYSRYNKDCNLYDSVALDLFTEYKVSFNKNFFENFIQRALCKILNYCVNKDCLYFYRIRQYFSGVDYHKSINYKVIQYTYRLFKTGCRL